MNILPQKAHRVLRSLFFCLITITFLAASDIRQTGGQTKYAEVPVIGNTVKIRMPEPTAFWPGEGFFNFKPVIATGRVVSTSGAPLPGVKVMMGGETVAVTDAGGFYKINNTTLRTKNAATFSAEGYVNNTRILRPGDSPFFPVVLAPVGNRVTFQAQQGGTFTLNKSVINIPPNAFVDSGGGTVAGPVELEFTLLDVTQPMERDSAMGQYTGRMLDGSIRPLQSYGVFDWRVRKNNEVVRLAPGAVVGVRIPIPRLLLREAPNRMGIFSIDNMSGIWVQTGWFDIGEGRLTYNGTITAMNGFNLDIVGPGTCITIKLVSFGGWPLDLSGFNVTASGTGYSAEGTTDSSGRVCLVVKQGDSVTIHAYKGSYASYPLYNYITAPTTNSDEDDCGDPVKCQTITIEVAGISGGG